MNQILGFDLSNEILFSFPQLLKIFLAGLFFVALLYSVKLSFGKEIFQAIQAVVVHYFQQIKKRRKQKGHPDWLAECTYKQGWPKNGDAEPLNLEGKQLKKLSFWLEPKRKPEKWRAGFIIGTNKFRPEEIINTTQAITIHAGSPPQIHKANYIWIYDSDTESDENYITVKSYKPDFLKFEIEIVRRKELIVHINHQLVYSGEIDPKMTKKVYLLAWVTTPNARSNFLI